MLLAFSNQEPFATGAANYYYNPIPGSDTSARIILPVLVEGEFTSAVVDTAAPFLVCSTELAVTIGFDPSYALGPHILNIRGYRVRGSLHRVELALLATTGIDLPVDVTAFVPYPDEPSDFPSFLGFWGCLERIRFAVDPSTSMFYFGPHP
ncbi:MAG: hypothetical protein ACREEM_33550 [Blastocatellia bacterium]